MGTREEIQCIGNKTGNSDLETAMLLFLPISYFLTVARLDVSPAPNPRGELGSCARANYRPSSLKWARTTLSIPVLTSPALHVLVSLKPTLGSRGQNALGCWRNVITRLHPPISLNYSWQLIHCGVCYSWPYGPVQLTLKVRSHQHSPLY